MATRSASQILKTTVSVGVFSPRSSRLKIRQADAGRVGNDGLRDTTLLTGAADGGAEQHRFLLAIISA